MAYREFDKNIKFPVSDIISHASNLIVASYDKNIRIYSEWNLIFSIALPTPITKLFIYQEYIIGLSYTAGIIYIFNDEYILVDAISSIPNPYILIASDEQFIIGSINQSIYMLRKSHLSSKAAIFTNLKSEYILEDLTDILNGHHIFEIFKESKLFKIITAGIFKFDKFYIAVEKELLMLSLNLELLSSKEFNSCITVISSSNQGILVGLLDGKIHYDNHENQKESFVFNSHIALSATNKIIYPNTHIIYDEFLFSSGADGKICQWDLEHKKKLRTIFSNDTYIRKFMFYHNNLLILLDDPKCITIKNILITLPLLKF